jgi:hypothetical protein
MMAREPGASDVTALGEIVKLALSGTLEGRR